jgi:GMP synthase-like glutamine amidotransferase
MRLLLMKHFDFDDPSSLAAWADRHGHSVLVAEPPYGFTAPALNDFDLLIILGGPMSAYQDELFPWLTAEKQFILSAVSAGKYVLGICLGAQLLAEVTGGRVYRNEQKEIGWHPVCRTNLRHPLFDGVPEAFHSFQWHGDCFDIPEGGVPLAYSEACRQQAFAYGDRVLGLQFHLETSPACMETMLAQWEDELVPAPYIQSRRSICEQSGRSAASFHILHQILNNFEKSFDAAC